MIRVLIPQYTYTDARLKLVERMSHLSFRSYSGIRRRLQSSEKPKEMFHEGVFESEAKLPIVAMRLTDNPLLIHQTHIIDMPTWLIEDKDEVVY